MATATYQYMYNVTRGADGSYALEDGAPAAQDVQFDSTDSEIAPGGEITITADFGLTGPYDYFGFVTTSEASIGYIVYNALTQQFYMLTDTAFSFAGNPSLALGNATSTGPGADMPACFVTGTRISVPGGEKHIEHLKTGDLVLTTDGRAVPVLWIGRQTVTRPFADEFSLPVRIKAGAVDENVPRRDLLVSQEHALFIDGVLVQAGALINGTTVVREVDVPKTFVYYHIEVADHALILAENVPAETFVDNVERARFDNWREYEALYPAGKTVDEMPHPRAKARRQVPRAIRERLAFRAGAPGNNATAAA